MFYLFSARDYTRDHIAFDRLHVIICEPRPTVRYTRDLCNILPRNNLDERENVTLVVNDKKKKHKIEFVEATLKDSC